MVRVHAIFEGRVQGVFFRANCRNKAVEFGLTGWVKNLDDGRVEAVIDGPETKVDKLITWCRDSQPMARVSDVSIERIETTEKFRDFRITR